MFLEVNDTSLLLTFQSFEELSLYYSEIEKNFVFSWVEEEEIRDQNGNVTGTKNVNKYHSFLNRISQYEVTFLSGHLKKILEIFQSLNVQFQVIDNRVKYLPRNSLSYPIEPDILPDIILRDDYQVQTVYTVLTQRRGIIDIPTRGGKTEIILAVLAHYLKYENPEGTITILAKDNNLVSNLCSRLEKRNFQYSKVNSEGGDPSCQIIVCVINSIYNSVEKNSNPELRDRFMKSNVVIIDEVHQAAAHMFQTAMLHKLSENPPDILLTVSGTPFVDTFDPNTNVRDVALIGMTGGVIIRISDEFLIQRGYKARGNIIWLEPKKVQYKIHEYKYFLVYRKFIIHNYYRNALAFECVKYITAAGFKCLVLVKEISHGKKFLESFINSNISVKFRCGSEGTFRLIDGKVDKDEVDENPNYDIVESFNRGEFQVLIGSSIFNTGSDFPGCNWMILLSGEGRENDILNRQRASRIQCPCSYDNNGYIIDFVDSVHPYLSSQSVGRNNLYRQAGFNSHFSIETLQQLINSSKHLKDSYGKI